MRLDKLLADAGIGTRSEVKKLINKGLVKVDEKICKDASMNVNPEINSVMYNNEPVFYAENRYYMLNKPAGTVSATKDALSDTVLDMLKGVPTKNLFPVGRLDKDTEGLLLITDDGALAHNLLSPKKHVSKDYYVKTDKDVKQEFFAAFEQGMDIGDEKPTLPAKLVKLGECEYRITIVEGRYHQVKRMFEKCDSNVIFLKRLSMGPLMLDAELNPGEFRALTDEEIQALKDR